MAKYEISDEEYAEYVRLAEVTKIIGENPWVLRFLREAVAGPDPDRDPFWFAPEEG